MPVSFHTIPPKDNKQTSDKLSSSITLAPRLITVVEIVKREFLRGLATKRSPRLKGLHQYNEIGLLDEKPEAEGLDTEQARSKQIVEALSGKNQCVPFFKTWTHPHTSGQPSVKQTQTPYMRVTLSLIEIPSLQRGTVT